MHSVFEFLSLLQSSGVLGICLVLIGWRVVYQNAKRLATRSETKGFIDDLMKIVSELEKSGVDYWLAGRKERAEPRNHELLMLAKLAFLYQKLDLLSARNIDIEDIILLTGLLQDGMLLDCEKADQMPLDERSKKAHEVLAYGKDIQTALYQKFLSKYPPKL